MAKILHYRPGIQIILRHSLNLEQQLGDMGSVSLSKRLDAPCGEFSIQFPDHPLHRGSMLFGVGSLGPSVAERKSLYDIVDILDPIEIKLKRWQDGSKTDNEWVTVLRGFVRSIGRDEEVDGDGRVQRSVVIAGQDCGAAFLMEMLGSYISIANNPENTMPTWMKHLREFDLSPEPTPLSQFIRDVAYSTTQDIMATAKWEFSPLLYVQKGYAMLNFAFSAEGSVWELLKRFSSPPWNELFVREGKTSPELVFRPTPWFDASGALLPDATLESVSLWEIPMRNVIALSAHRDDTEQVQHAVVQNANAHMFESDAVLYSGRGNFNTELRAKFGDRIQVVQDHSGPAKPFLSVPEDDVAQANLDYKAWIEDRTDWLVKAGQDIYKLEKGSITIKGDPRIRVGDYVWVVRGAIRWSAYVVAVSHRYSPYRSYLTTLEYIRSDQWIKRQQVENPWSVERKQEA